MSKAQSRDEDEISSSPLRSRLIKLAIWLLILPIILFGLSNLWLESSWGTDIAEGELEARTGMDWEVHGMSWSPWGGVNIKEAVMLQPEELREDIDQPLLEVQRITVQPYWRQLLRGEMKLREVSVDSPQITVAVEMLAALTSNVSRPRVAQASQKSVVEQPKVQPTTPKHPRPQSANNKKPKPKKKPVVSPQDTQPERPAAGLPLRVLVKNASVNVLSVVKDLELLGSSGVDLNLPLAGEDTEGMIHISELNIPGVETIRDVEQVVVWKRPYLEMEEQIFELGGVKLRGITQLGVLRGFPFLIDLVIDPQELESLSLLDRVALDVKSDQLAGRARASGSLVNPLSWKSSMLVQSSGFSVLEKHGGRQLHFDELFIPAVFQVGTLNWSSARVIGEDISFLGNGRLSIQDGITSVTRLVAEPELARTLQEAMIGAHLTGHHVWWEDLETPDRKYRDIHIMGPLTEPSIDLGPKHVDFPLWQTLSAVIHFIREEMKEEGITLQPVPNRNLLPPKTNANY